MNKKAHSIRELINSSDFDSYYILDFDKESTVKTDGILFEEYYLRNRKINENSLFLYRQPKRSAKNRKFYFYGGGIISKIEENTKGNIAYITNGFEFVTPITEDDKQLNEMIWTSKNKTNGWDHFWNQYGINEINKEDFLSIAENNLFLYHSDSMVESIENELDTFTTTKDKYYLKDYAVDSILRYENDRISKLNLDPKYEAILLPKSAKLDLGYDILSYDEKGLEIHIEVKLSPYGQRRFLQISSREYKMFKDPKFRIYTVYNLDIENGTFELDIKTGDEMLKDYDYEPVLYRANLKKEEV